jgi:hypothetical protein
LLGDLGAASRSPAEFSQFKNEPRVNVLALLLCSKGQRLFLLPAESEKESKKNRAILLIEGLAAACEVSMTDLHQARNPNPNAGIDAVGWLFSALVAAIVAVAAVIAYEANDTRPNSPVS